MVEQKVEATEDVCHSLVEHHFLGLILVIPESPQYSYDYRYLHPESEYLSC